MKHAERPITDWLPITMKEVEMRGWDELDVVLFSGDAYVDHPTFGTSVIGRIVESAGFRIGIVPQPNWRDDLRDFKKMGKPRLFFAISGGCMDSMVNHYTANRRKRSTDAYTPGGQAGFRPDHTTATYSKILKELYPDVPVVIGGIEASLRRVTHYDYWADRLMPTILESSQADLLVYGMGEQALRQILALADKGVPISSMRDIPQTAFLQDPAEPTPNPANWEEVELASHEVCLQDKKAFAGNFKIVEQESNKTKARRINQMVRGSKLVINPPFPTMTELEMDASFDLPYTRLPHPKYKKRGAIPAFEMIKFSINMHRGCFGGCSFCTISAHQGKFIASRSQESIMKEVEQVVNMPDFKGYISDLGGPSANMYRMKGKVQSICDRCSSPSCIHPVVCSNLDTSHKPMTELYRKVDEHPKVKKAFVGSGIRYDLLTETYNKQADESVDEYLEQVVTRHISGRLKVAPEHTSENTLKIMRKPAFKHFHAFKKKYDKINKQNDLNQPLIPYFISAHPGCQEADMANLAAETKDMGFKLEQVQNFTPTPMTVATVIYYSGYHPYTLEPVFTAKTEHEQQNQHKFFFWYKPENRGWIRDRLIAAGKPDLAKRLLAQPKSKAPQKSVARVGKSRIKPKHNGSSTGHGEPRKKRGNSRPEFAASTKSGGKRLGKSKRRR
ncbi:YgiQ family radical SAM protein [Pontibacter sp. G13]|uniref:YgiQ family radical SAM protein n=1 Tax=Pontibacter sp. G13 TaxID=3074898 RepID=UPI00288C0656|nr:YgiQ family radical SAM protein [Pontibacter sp. G13]WNJ17516.1 YgiQ family radical SAM protein [Pontibacter sp. G13]